MRFDKLSMVLILLFMIACKPKQEAAANPGPPGPPTRFGEHMTPSFTDVSAYAAMVRTNAARTYLDVGQRPFTTRCDDPSINISMRPRNVTIESCFVKATTPDDIQLAAKISNGWLIVSDSNGTRRVKTEEFPNFQ